ncbi:MAG: SpoIID/LytB domain-containing protein [Syntrophaceae bacterium]|nr:SpoIID/LytB domain-containing protein [Syntrophaceae bacterium]
MRANQILRYIITFMIFMCSVSYGFAYSEKQAMGEADAYLKNGQYLEALGAYQDVSDLSSRPEMKAGAILKMGDIYSYFLNDHSLALEQYAIVIKKYGSTPHAANALLNAGMILYEKRLYKEALNHFQTYLRKFPRGERKETVEFMIEMCSRPSPELPEKKHPFHAPKGENVRVLIMSGVRQIRVESTSLLEVRDADGKDILNKHQRAIIEIGEGMITLNGAQLSRNGLLIMTAKSDMLSVNGAPYRGYLKIRKRAAGGMDVINILDVDAYLYGVVPKEMSPQWHPEALKAQAIAARTYVLYQKGKNKNRDYDVIASTTSQVYGGAGAEIKESNQAVDETRGMVILYNGQLALTYFHSNSGGMTEDAKRVWNADIPYLRTVKDEYSIKAPNSSWTLSLSTDTIRYALNNKGSEIGSIERLVPVDVSPSGRIQKIKIFHGGGESVVKGTDFRITIDPVLIKSTLFTIINDEEKIHLEGRGYGHGVGMSQWGAYMMAREGYSYNDILKHYYRGVEIR